jgi:hypothetical protein
MPTKRIHTPLTYTLAAFTFDNLEVKIPHKFPYFTGTKEELYDFFYKAGERNPELFRAIEFGRNRRRPRIEDINKIFTTLEAHELLTHFGNHPPIYQTSRDMLELYRKIPDEIRDDIRSLGIFFGRRFGCDQIGKVKNMITVSPEDIEGLF